MENQTPEVVLPPQKPKSNFALWVVVVVAILAVGIGIGVIAGKFSQPISSSTSSPKVVLSPIPSPTTVPVETVDPTANWKTYTNNKHNFSFKYPPELAFLYDGIVKNGPLLIQNFDGTNASGNQTGDFQIALFISSDSMNKTLEEYANQGSSGNTQKITVGGKEAIKGFSIQKQESVPSVWIKGSNSFLLVQLSTSKSSNRLWFDQILSTFKFANTQSIVTPTLTSKATSLYYKLPNGWKTMQNETGMFEVGYDSEKTTTNLTYGPGAISIFINGTIGGAAMAVRLADYDGGSRHAFIFTQMGVPPTKGDAPEKYKEVEYIYNGKSCLFLENLYYSQSPSIWGMCDVGKGKAILMTAGIPDYVTTLQTIKIIK